MTNISLDQSKKIAAAAAANLSKKSTSLNIIDMFAANFGMATVHPVLL